jgi:hypothetical protein
MDSFVPQSRPSQLRAVRDTERNTEGIGDALSRELTGRNSPHNTNQPAKRKTDRVPVKYSFGVGSLGEKLSPPIDSPAVIEGDSWGEEKELFRRPVLGCLGNAA